MLIPGISKFLPVVNVHTIACSLPNQTGRMVLFVLVYNINYMKQQVGLVAALVGLARTLLPTLQSLQAGDAPLRRLVALWSALCGYATGSSSSSGSSSGDARVCRECIQFVEVLAMLAPEHLPGALPR
jgi:hypothetical protein